MRRYILILLLTTVSLNSLARTFGVDSRQVPEAKLTPAEQSKFSGVGQIECRASYNRVFAYTAFLVGVGDTAVTLAHAFDYQRLDANGKPTGERDRHNPKNCWFALFQKGLAVDKIQIRFIMSRWDIKGLYNDPSQDVAVVKLTRLPLVPAQVPGIAQNKVEDLTLVSFHGDIENGTSLRKVTGKSYELPKENFAMTKLAAEAGTQVSNLENVFIADYDSGGNASGGPIYDAKSDSIVGIHMGSYEAVGAGGEFNPHNNFNFGIYFDREILDFIIRVMETP